MTDDEAALELLRSETAVPTELELECVDRAIEIARASGLRLPPAVVVRWRRYVPAAAIGCCEGEVIYLAAGLRLEHLAETSLHELAHCHDFSSGRRFPRAESEARAIRYAARMLPHWRARTLPSPYSRAATAARPKSLAPSGDASRARMLASELERRLSRLRHRVSGTDRLAVSALMRISDELAALATRKA